MKKLEQLRQIQEEIELYYKKLSKEENILDEYFNNLNLKRHVELYYKVFFSRMSYDADILFIGINPGGGEEWCSPLEKEKFEYVEYDYSLAYETKKVFELANYKNLLQVLDENNRVVKTNLYYLVTENKSQLEHFINHILNKEQREEFIENHKNWASKIIDLSNPKIIIYEGKSAFNESPPYFNNAIRLVDFEKDGIYLVKLKDYKSALIGFSRFQSRILNKEILAEVLEKELDTIEEIKIYKHLTH
ncbi:hypothetical protein J4771_00820 [Candidatus Kaistella beijingensis]|uniref:hypothetical protein n=1 Tax=Candidatus Kaistella beijingensis TaxID=2820270 RepID=UPI001CC342C4|nr:hypothetical protein [Candidatus Kaistella beijingensis]UBB89925.1 hypothetical protein J4771_00820 [Candidatus Kaistella beijingensis]